MDGDTGLGAAQTGVTTGTNMDAVLTASTAARRVRIMVIP